MSFCEVVCSVTQDTVEALVVFSQMQNHILGEGSHRDHWELSKIMERAWKEKDGPS